MAYNPVADNDEAVPMITFSMSKDADGEVVLTIDVADEFDVLADEDQESFLIQAADYLDEMLMALEDPWSGEDDDEPTAA
jgi:hypothetical protein